MWERLVDQRNRFGIRKTLGRRLLGSRSDLFLGATFTSYARNKLRIVNHVKNGRHKAMSITKEEEGKL